MSRDLIHISSPANNHLLIEGTLHASNVTELVERITAHALPPTAHLTLDFDGAELRDGLSLLTVLNTLQALSRRVAELTILHPPATLRTQLAALIEQGSTPHITLEEEIEVEN